MRVLVVTNPFQGRDKGELITDPYEIEAIIASEHAGHVVAADHTISEKE